MKKLFNWQMILSLAVASIIVAVVFSYFTTTVLVGDSETGYVQKTRFRNPMAA